MQTFGGQIEVLTLGLLVLVLSCGGEPAADGTGAPPAMGTHDSGGSDAERTPASAEAGAAAPREAAAAGQPQRPVSTPGDAELGHWDAGVAASDSLDAGGTGGKLGPPDDVASPAELCRARFLSAPGGSSGFGVGSVHTDRADNVIIAGTFIGTIELGSTTLRADTSSSFVMKLDMDCQLLWAKSFSGDPDSRLSLVAISSDSAGNIYVGGTFAGVVDLGNLLASAFRRDTGILAKLAPNGDVLWSRAYGSLQYDGSVTGVEVDSHDHVVISGKAAYDTSFGGGPVGTWQDAIVSFVAQLDADASHRWSRAFTATFDIDATLSPDDSIVISGWDRSRGTFSRNLGRLSEKGMDLWLHDPTVPASDGHGYWVSRLAVARSGEILLARGVVHTDADGNILATDAALEKYTASGDLLSSYAISPGADLDFGRWSAGLALDAEGLALYSIAFSDPTQVAGTTFRTRGDGDDVLLVKLKADGEPKWALSLGGELHDILFGMTTDSQRNVVVAYHGTVLAGSQSELVVVKLAP